MMTEAQQCLTASYTFGDEPLVIEDTPGLKDAVETVNADHSEEIYVRQDDGVIDYKVYWNSSTETVRIAALVVGATYEVPENTDKTLYDYE